MALTWTVSFSAKNLAAVTAFMIASWSAKDMSKNTLFSLAAKAAV
jgi:hypothetical protein